MFSPRNLDYLGRMLMRGKDLPDLTRPDLFRWPQEPLSATQVAEVENLCTCKPYTRLRHYLVAAALLAGRRDVVDAVPALRNWAHAADGFGLPQDGEIDAWRWAMVPVVAAESLANAEILYLLIGCRPGGSGIWPRDVHLQLDEASIAAVRDALTLAQKRTQASYLCTPCGERQILGRSLGLPVYLAAMSLARGRPMPKVLATGDVTAEGGLLPVSGLEAKQQQAKSCGFSAFLFPGNETSLPTLEELETLPVSRLEHGVTLWDHFEAGKGGPLRRFLAVQDLPAELLAWLEQTEAALVEWVAGNCPHEFLGAVRGVLENQLGIKQLVVLLEDWRKQDSRKLQVLMRSIKPDDVRMAGGHTPRCAFDVCIQAVRLANHAGDITGSDRWLTLATNLYAEKLRDSDADMEDLYLLVQGEVNCHNRYCFRPQVSDDMLESVALKQEDFERLAQRKNGQHYSEHFGKCLGLLGQCAAFCGPAYLAEAEAYLARSRRAFGEHLANGKRTEVVREHIYHMHALVDAGRMEDARHVLRQVFDRQEFDASAETSLEALLRIAVDSKDPYMLHVALKVVEGAVHEPPCLQGIVEKARAAVQEIGDPLCHPWQLIFFNAARLYGQGSTRHVLLQAALQTAAKGELTIRVMSLMPLALLHEEGGLDEAEGRKIFETCVQGCLHSALHAPHFAPHLVPDDMPGTLAHVRQAWRVIFPFNYN